MKKISFASLPKNIVTSKPSRHTAGPEGIVKMHKQWSENFRAKTRARRITFSTGARTSKIDGLKDFRIKFVLSKNF